MAKGPFLFKKTDVRRAVEAAEEAGLKVGRIEISAGKISVVPAGAGDVVEDAAEEVKL
jgi:hypothetical protein